ncbi:MAG: ATP-binding cassette domain-containing protein [Bryobacteraceae bacterium]|jgi:ABC-2 type transport system ATP-binding protein
MACNDEYNLLGLNGAGKTTTIRILLDLLRPTSGHAFIFGHDCQRGGLHARSNIGYLPGEMGIYSDLTALKCSISSPGSAAGPSI